MTFRSTRRNALKLLGAGIVSASFAPHAARAAPAGMLQRPIPSSGETIAVIGMGTWQTFNVGSDRQLRLARTEVLEAMFAHGGGMVDCSPMYGSSADVLGFALGRAGTRAPLFAAEKVWTGDGSAARGQIGEQQARWGIARFDLVQIHNLVAWQAHLATLREMKRAGGIRYLGITTSHGRRHREVERIMQREPIDFVQLTYNLTHREVEQRLLPLANEKGIAVIANRPYDGGRLIKELKRRASVPRWAVEAFDCRGWADYLLRFIVSHPAVTCAIPATTRVAHMHENMNAGRGPMPGPELRQRMIRHVESL